MTFSMVKKLESSFSWCNNWKDIFPWQGSFLKVSWPEDVQPKGNNCFHANTIILTQNNKFLRAFEIRGWRGTSASLIPLAFHISNRRVSISLNWLHNGLAIAQSMPIMAKVMTIWLLTEWRACGDPVFPYSWMIPFPGIISGG